MAAPVWKSVLKWTAWLLGGTLAIPIVCYLVLLLINWRDRPPSEAALRLAADYRDRPAIADSDNGYVYTMGFTVAPDVDPRAAGIQRIAWLRSFHPDTPTPPPGDPVVPYKEYGSFESAAGRKIFDACTTGSDQCLAALEQGDSEIDAWLESEQWLLDRYATLLRHPGWQETVPLDLLSPMIAFRMPLDGQRLLLAKAYALAGQNDAAAVRELLGNDARFWRQVLASSDILITKMVATAALNRGFEVGNLAVRRMPAELQMAALPQEWTTPLSSAELSMLRCLTGEWMFSARALDQAMLEAETFADGDQESERAFLDTMLGQAALPMFQSQDTKNRRAEMFLRASDALQVPIEQFATGLDRARQIFQDPAPGNPLTKLYNPIGNLLITMGAHSYSNYPPRVADVEGVRRAAVLAAELRASKVDREHLAAELDASKTRTPYTGAPFTWDTKQQAIVFVGMAQNERGRHALKY